MQIEFGKSIDDILVLGDHMTWNRNLEPSRNPPGLIQSGHLDISGLREDIVGRLVKDIQCRGYSRNGSRNHSIAFKGFTLHYDVLVGDTPPYLALIDGYVNDKSVYRRIRSTLAVGEIILTNPDPIADLMEVLEDQDYRASVVLTHEKAPNFLARVPVLRQYAFVR